MAKQIMTENEIKVCARKAVTSELINMLSNNNLDENGWETFEGWCELPNADYGVFGSEPLPVKKECARLVNIIKKKVDEVTEILAVDNLLIDTYKDKLGF